MAMNMCAAFWWSSSDGVEAEIRGNGTICYVNTGVRRIGITCDHVFQGYLDDKTRFPDVECQFGNNTFDPESRLIDRSPISEFDLAVFDVPEVFVSASNENYFHNAPQWPPMPAATTDVVMYGGYPQVLRSRRKGEHKVDFPFQWIATKVNDANSARIALEPGIATLHWPGHEGETINTSFHGQSGGPVYRVIDAAPDKGEVVDRLELIGIIDRQFMGDLVLARPVGIVGADGCLIR